MTPGAFSGLAAARQALLQALQWGLAADARLLHAWDARLVDWPWSDDGLLQALTRWAGPGRQLQLLAQQYEDLARQHPRFVRWRRDYAHCVQARALEPEVNPQGAPQALLLIETREAKLSLRLLDSRLWRGELSLEAGDYRRGREWFDAIAQRSGESFAPTTLGL